jgi:hypothetical protein
VLVLVRVVRASRGAAGATVLTPEERARAERLLGAADGAPSRTGQEKP